VEKGVQIDKGKGAKVGFVRPIYKEERVYK